MFQLKNIGIVASSSKTGQKQDGTQWLKHGYKFMGVEGWFSKFVSPGTPLYSKGTIVKELQYEDDGQYKNIKQMIVQSVPKPDAQGGPSVAQKLNPWENKEHPIWFCGRWATDLVVARMEKITAKEVNEVSGTLGDKVVDISLQIYNGLKKHLVLSKQSQGTTNPATSPGLQEPKQEPDQGPEEFDENNPPPDDNIPF